MGNIVLDAVGQLHTNRQEVEKLHQLQQQTALAKFTNLVIKQEAERKIKSVKQMDKKFDLGLQNEIAQTEQGIEVRDLEARAREYDSVGDSKEEWEAFVSSKSPEFLKKHKIPKKYTRGNPSLRKDFERGVNDIPFMRKLLLKKVEMVGKQKLPPYTPPKAPQYFKGNSALVGVQAIVSQHPQFKKMKEDNLLGLIPGFGVDVFESPQFKSVVADLTNESNALMARSHNKALARRDHKVMQPPEALQLAFEKKLAFLHKSTPDTKELIYLTPEAATLQQQQWMSNQGKELADNTPGFYNISPEEQIRILQEKYELYQLYSYALKNAESRTRRTYGE